MCEFCEGKKLIMDYKKITSEIEENYMTIRVYSKERFLQSFKINYCPMCGEKLESED